MELCNTIFNSILLHRIKDFHEEVRTIAVQYILHYIRFDLKRTIHVEYLKYLGWACSDYASSVRLEAIRGIHSLAEVRITGRRRNCYVLLYSVYIPYTILYNV